MIGNDGAANRLYINNGVALRSVVTAPASGKIGGAGVDFSFVVKLNGATTGTTVQVTSAAQGDNTSAAMFVSDINSALGAAGLSSKLIADLVGGNLVRLRASDTTIYSINVSGQALGIFAPNPDSLLNKQQYLTSAAVPSNGQLASAFSFAVKINGGAAVTVTVTTVMMADNRNDGIPGHADYTAEVAQPKLASDFNDALAAAGLATKLNVILTADGKLAVSIFDSTVTAFEIVSQSTALFTENTAANNLRLPSFTSTFDLPSDFGAATTFSFRINGAAVTSYTVAAGSATPAAFASALKTQFGASGLDAEIVGGKLQVFAKTTSTITSLALDGVSFGFFGSAQDAIFTSADAQVIDSANAANHTKAIALGDVNGDGNADLVVGKLNEQNLVFINNGGVTPFSAAGLAIGTTTFAVTSVSLGDVNADGKLDIAFGGNLAQTRLYLNSSNPNDPFGSVVPTLVGLATDATNVVLLANVDGDSDADLFTGTGGQGARFFVNGVKVTKIAIANLEVTYSGQGLKNGTGALLMTPNGVAGFFSGEVALAAGGVELGGSVGVRVNTTGAAVNDAINFNGQTYLIVFPTPPPPVAPLTKTTVFEFFGSDLTLNIGNFVTINGNVSFDSNGNASGSSLDVFLGQGPLYDDATAKTRNPNARGVLLHDAVAGLKRVDVSGVKKYAVFASGVIELIGIDGVTFTGQVTVRFNNTGAPQSLTFPDPDGPANPLEPQTETIAEGAAEFIGAIDLAAAGQTLSGTFAFSSITLPGPDGVVGTSPSDPKGRDDVKQTKVGVAGLHVGLGDGTTDFVSVDNGTGGFLLTPTGIAGNVSATVSLNIPGAVDFAGTFSLLINTTTKPVSETIDVGGTPVVLSLPAGPYLKIEGGTDTTPIILTIAGQQLRAKFAFEQYTQAVSPGAPPGTVGAKIIRVAITDLSFALSAGSTDIVSLTGGTGFFVIKPTGMAGEISGTVAIPVIGFSGTLKLSINNSTVPVAETFTVAGQDIALNLPAGPYLRFEGTNLQLNIAGQKIGGDFAFEKADTVIRVIAKNVVVRLGDGTTDYLSLTDGSAALLLTSAGLAGQLGGTVNVNIPGITLAGTFKLSINNTTTAGGVHTTFVGSQLNGTTALASLRSGNGITIESVAKHLRITTRNGDVVDVNLTGSTTLNDVVSKINTAAGKSLVRLENSQLIFTDSSAQVGANRLTITALNSSVAGTQLGIVKTATAPLSGKPDVITSDILANDTVTLDLPQGPYVKIEGVGVELTVAGQVIGGDFAFEQLTKPNGTRVVKVAVARAHIALGEPGNPIIEINQADGQAALFLITPAGFAGKIEANPTLNLGGAVTLNNAMVTVAINNTTAEIHENFVVGGTTYSLDLPRGPFLRAELQGATSGTAATISVAGVTLSGNFSFEQATNSTGQKRVKLALSQVGLDLGGFVTVSNGRGAFLLTPAGMAGTLSADVALGNLPEGVVFEGSFGLSINTSARPVNETFTAGSETITLSLPAGPYLRVEGNDILLSVAGQTLSGDFAFETITKTDPGTGAVTKQTRIKLDNIHLAIGDGTTDIVTLDGGHGFFILLPAKPASGATPAVPASMAGTLGGTVTLNVPGVTFQGTFGLTINTGTNAVHEELTFSTLD